MKIALVHYPGRLARISAARAGTAPTEFLFGAIELENSGHEIAAVVSVLSLMFGPWALN